MADYLEARLREGKITSEMDDCDLPDADTRALFVMTLGDWAVLREDTLPSCGKTEAR
jgi:hypothetical protein